MEPIASYKIPSLLQPERGYRFSVDSLLLLKFAQLKPEHTLCDIGAGVGVIGLLALRCFGLRSVSAIELQSELAEFAQKNAALLGLESQYSLFVQNWETVENTMLPQSFDRVISNPPYRSAQSGRIAPQHSRALARHEICGTMRSLLASAAYLMKKDGRFCLMYPPFRYQELQRELTRLGMCIMRLQWVHSFADKPAYLGMFELAHANSLSQSKDKSVKEETPLIIYESVEKYMPEIEAWIGPKRR